MQNKLKLKEKIGYALGDTAANIAWRTLTTFLLVFYTDVFGIPAAAAGILLLVTRLSDGITDIIMGIIGDRTNTKYGKFRPWILWTALPFGVIMALTFTTPNLGLTGKLIYAYITYISLTLIYTANNVPYSALMGVMTSDDKERTSISSFRFAGAYFGGIITQGLLIYLVFNFGNVNPDVSVEKHHKNEYRVEITGKSYVENAEVYTKKGLAKFVWANGEIEKNTPTSSKSFEMFPDSTYSFIVTNIDELDSETIRCINQKKGYQHSVYLLSILLVVLLLITFLSTRERVTPPKSQKTNVLSDLKDLLTNRPWLILLAVGFVFVTYNSIKQGITVIYFKRYINNEALAATYMVVLLIVSMVAALVTTPLANFFGKKRLFIYVMLFSAVTNALLFIAGDKDISTIFIFGTLSEFGAGIMPVLFFTMLGDSADYSEWKHNRRATGLVYSAGTFSMKFGGGMAGAIIGFVLSNYGYDGMNEETIAGAIPGIKMLMSWVPAIITIPGVLALIAYPLSKEKLATIEADLSKRR
jgi:GPH family glycoside/pentoside/hexuronide:cation symporter